MLPRSHFPLLAAHPALHYLDSAATAQKPGVVLDALRAFYETANANPHRGAYALAAEATRRYHDARERVAGFFGVRDAERLIFTRGTTEALNLVAGAWGAANLRAGDAVVVTALDHHANFVTWQQAARRAGAEFRICELTAAGVPDLDQLRVLARGAKVVAFPHVSNALGSVLPVREIAAIAHTAGALAVCDGAQGAPHLRADVDALDVDFYAFSGHKMGGPMGIGGVIGRRDLLEAMPPWQFGGDMIAVVGDQESSWNQLPHKFEAGTPNVADAVGLAAATDWLAALGPERIRAHEVALGALAQRRLEEVEGLTVHGPPRAEDRSGVVSFTLADVHPHDLATILDERDVCIRAGHHCAQPLMRRLGVPATARASFWVYNDEADVDALVVGVREAMGIFAAGA
ncbi:MAG TPA: SufS family cysteine desulfurase [Gemmatimonadaceae bacterium]|nr:SufS family cysteine desulfurase [Gemmatimonadaceae bacterium]